MVLGASAALAGAPYVALGWLQELVGVGAGMAVGFGPAGPAALIVLAVLRRHPETGR
jgi:FSR family fosmidomycin resistance protein-like MFS transporter